MNAPLAPQAPVAAQDPTANCIFCKIVSGEIPSRKVYEDDKVIAVLDVFPATPGHIIIIPRTHYMILPQLPPELVEHCSVIAKQLSAKVIVGMAAKGVDVFVANGAIAGQKAPHFLMHVIPRYENDGINFTLPETQLPDAELEKIHGQIMPVIQKLGLGSGQSQQPSVQPQQQPVASTPQPQIAPQAPQVAPQQPITQPPMQPQIQPAQPEVTFPGQKTEQELVEVFNQNPDLKQLLTEKPDVVKQLVATNPKIGELFVGHSIDALHQKVKSGTLGTDSHSVNPVTSATSNNVQQPIQSAAQQPMQEQPIEPQQHAVPQQPVQPQPAPQPILQSQAQPQQALSEQQLMQIIQSQPELKQAIIENPAALVQAIQTNPQLQQIFNGHDIMKLAEQLKNESSNLDKIAAMFDSGGSQSQQTTEEKKEEADLDKISKLFDA